MIRFVLKSPLQLSTFLRPLCTSAPVKMELKQVLQVLNDFAPLDQAAPWDNVGLLVEPSKAASVDRILFTNDLTEAVMEEAVEQRADLILSYHPPIFKALKRVTQRSWKERLVCRCLEEGIALYSPHTAVDAKAGGVADWMLKPFDGEIKAIEPSSPSLEQLTHLTICTMPSADSSNKLVSELDSMEPKAPVKVSRMTDMSVHVMSSNKWLGKVAELTSELEGSANVIRMEKRVDVNMGMGRIKRLSEKIAIKEVIERVKKLVGVKHIRFALSTNHTLDTEVTTLASCAGSGASLLLPVCSSADVLITGEMSHHELLDAVHNGSSVVLCEHNNSERRYLLDMAEQLEPKLGDVKLIVSEKDADPVMIV